MSGSSLDGLDIVYVHLEEVRGQWSFDIQHAVCLPYTEAMHNDLRTAHEKPVADFLKLHTAYGRYMGEAINTFIADNGIDHKVDFIASHGHTVFHEPQNFTTCQIGDGAAIAAVTGLPVINDLRALDVALGGQGAPIVPIGDKLLFGQYDYLLNIGGIANITVPHNGGFVAFDICPANQVLNALALRVDKEMDENGDMARHGRVLDDVLADMNEVKYYGRKPPKSLSNEQARDMLFPKLLESGHAVNDMLCTVVYHIAEQVAKVIIDFPVHKENATLLVTGGGAFNQFLIEKIEETMKPLNISLVIPDSTVVKFKEALIMALIGTLRWREETNVLSSVTGATRDSIGGALWMGAGYN